MSHKRKTSPPPKLHGAPQSQSLGVQSGQRGNHIQTPSLRLITPTARNASEIVTLLNNTLGESYVTAQTVERRLADANTTVIGAYKDNTLIACGYGTITTPTTTNPLIRNPSVRVNEWLYKHHNTRIGLLETLAVHPTERNTGIGTRTVKHILASFTEHKATQAITVSWLHSGNSSLHLLKRIGFTPLDTLTNYWTSDSIKHNYRCPNCGNPCVCAAAILVKPLYG